MLKLLSQLSRSKGRSGRRLSAMGTVQRRVRFEHLEGRRLLAADLLSAFSSEVPHVVWAPGTADSVMAEFDNSRGIIGEAGGDINAVDGVRWSRTATNGSGLSQGDPTTLTWSVVPDGTLLGSGAGEANSPSNLQSFLNGLYGSKASWLSVLQQSFDSWETTTGIDFVYQSADDGVNYSNANQGVNGVRGDIRLGGHAIDGNSGILAYNWYPNYGDMVLDTSDSFFSSLSNNSLRLRNTVAHELGHGLGLGHSLPRVGTKLMEPSITLGIDGPQHDDILRANRGYGDRLEGNDSPATAYGLGTLGSSQLVLGNVSIDDDSDVDFFRFSVGTASQVDITLDPVGFVYTVGAEGSTVETIDSKALSNLSLTLLDSSGVNVIANASASGLGASEVLTGVNLSAGQYLLRVNGAQNAVQMYQLTLGSGATTADTTPPTLLSRTPAAGSTLTSSAVNIDLAFSETVVGLDASDLVLTGTGASSAAVGQPQNLGSNVWRFPVAGLISGTVNVSLAADANDIEDAAGNDLAPGAWLYTVSIATAQQPPVLASIADQVTTAGSPHNIQLSASDANGDPLTFSVSGNSLEYQLDQSLGLNSVGGNEYYNWLGLNEKWLIGSGSAWYYIKPNGEVYRWNGGAAANDSLVETVGSAAHANTALLHNAQVNKPPATLAVSGSTLVVTANQGFTGKFFVTVAVSDGRGGADSKSFKVTVQPGGSSDTTPPTVLSYTPANGQTVTNTSVSVDVTFSEVVVGVDSSDLQLSGAGAASAVVGTAVNVSGNTWRFPVSSLVTGLVQVTLAPDSQDIRDAANNNLAAVSWSFTVQQGTQPLPPVLASIPNQTTPVGQTLRVALNASDPNGDPLTFTITGQSEAYVLDQQLSLTSSGGNEYLNWGGKNEKWMNGTGGSWYYITPNGDLYRWQGGNLNSDTLVAALGSSYYQNTALLHNAAANSPPAALSISGSEAVIQPTAGFLGKFYVTVAVTDGNGGVDSKTFAVDVV